jgi:hypothetical protein
LGAEGWFRAGDVKAIGIVKIDNGLFRVIILFDNWSIPTFYRRICELKPRIYDTGIQPACVSSSKPLTTADGLPYSKT